MKTTIYKILRSIITSLLFLILTFAITIQFIFMNVHIDFTNLPNMIDRQELLSNALDKEIGDEATEKVAVKYIDDYLNYVFHKRSFPSLQTVDFSEVSEENLEYAKTTISTLSKNINLEYEDVLILREANNILSNRAIFLLINVGLFIIFLVVSIVNRSFPKGLKVLAVAMLASVILTMAAYQPIFNHITTNIVPSAGSIINTILDAEFKTAMTDLTFKYAGLAVLIYSITILYKKLETK